jgi:hypothetical protein
MYVCVYICMYVCIYIYMYVCMYVYIYAKQNSKSLLHSTPQAKQTDRQTESPGSLFCVSQVLLLGMLLPWDMAMCVCVCVCVCVYIYIYIYIKQRDYTGGEKRRN